MSPAAKIVTIILLCSTLAAHADVIESCSKTASDHDLVRGLISDAAVALDRATGTPREQLVLSRLSEISPSVPLNKILARAKEIKESDPTSLSFTEIAVILTYSGAAFETVNPALRGQKEKTDLIKAFVDTLNSALSKLPNYQGRVYRSANMPKEILKEHQTGESVLYPAFTSTSKNSFQGHLFGEHRFMIYSKRGKDISRYTFRPKEQEVA